MEELQAKDSFFLFNSTHLCTNYLKTAKNKFHIFLNSWTVFPFCALAVLTPKVVSL